MEGGEKERGRRRGREHAYLVVNRIQRRMWMVVSRKVGTFIQCSVQPPEGLVGHVGQSPNCGVTITSFI